MKSSSVSAKLLTRLISYTTVHIRSSFALVQLCCRTNALRASFLQQHPVAVHASRASSSSSSSSGTRGGFLGRTITIPQGRGVHSRVPATAVISSFYGRSGDVRSPGAAGRPPHSTTKAAILAATLLLSSSSSVVVEGAARFGGWGVRRRGAHSTPSMTASAVASDVTAGGGASAVGGVAVGGDAAAAGAGAKPKAPVVFVLGGPGSGKGTQCERLAKEYG